MEQTNDASTNRWHESDSQASLMFAWTEFSLYSMRATYNTHGVIVDGCGCRCSRDLFVRIVQSTIQFCEFVRFGLIDFSLRDEVKMNGRDRIGFITIWTKDEPTQRWQVQISFTVNGTADARRPMSMKHRCRQHSCSTSRNVRRLGTHRAKNNNTYVSVFVRVIKHTRMPHTAEKIGYGCTLSKTRTMTAYKTGIHSDRR